MKINNDNGLHYDAPQWSTTALLNADSSNDISVGENAKYEAFNRVRRRVARTAASPTRRVGLTRGRCDRS